MKFQALLTIIIFPAIVNANSQDLRSVESQKIKISTNRKTGITTVVGKRKTNFDFHPVVFNKPLNISDSISIHGYPFQDRRFSQSIDFDEAKFLGDGDFGNSAFNKTSSFRYTTFYGPCDFSYAQFVWADFSYASFMHNVAFNISNFEKEASFDKSNFEAVNFRGSTFKKTVSFIDVRINKNADFYGVTFSDTVNFNYSEFSNATTFQDAAFNNRADFEGVGFNGRVDFSSLRLSNKTELNFTGTSFPDTIDFSYNSKLPNEIDFTVASFNDWNFKTHSYQTLIKPSYINLYRTDISKLKLDYIHFKLYFSNKQEGMVNNGVVAYDDKNIVYEMLLNNFKSHGQTESYKILDIEYQQFKLEHSGNNFYKWLFKYWWNFGYDKEYIFRWTIGFLLFFTFINFFFINVLNNKIYRIESIPRHIPTWRSTKGYKKIGINLAMINKRIWFSLVYTTAIFFKVTLKIENFHFKHVVGTIYLFVVYITGLVCLAYMANFVLQKT